jgi:hypothetical protein
MWLEDALQVLVPAKLHQGPRVASLSPVILVTSGNKEAVVGGFMGIVCWNVALPAYSHWCLGMTHEGSRDPPACAPICSDNKIK